MSRKLATGESSATESAGSTLRPVYIYALTEPDGTPRYVGQSANPRARLYQHCSGKGRVAAAVRAWVESLRDRGEKPRLQVLHKVRSDQSAALCERNYIEHLGKAHLLLNVRCVARSEASVRLDEWIEREGITVSELARRLGVDASVVNRWTLHSRPKPARALLLEAETGIPAHLWRSKTVAGLSYGQRQERKVARLKRAVSISTSKHHQDTPPPRAISLAAAPSAVRSAAHLCTHRANAQTRGNASSAEHSHSANVRHCGIGERLTAQVSK